MLVKIIRALVAVLMVISPALPQKLSLPAIPNGQEDLISVVVQEK